MTTDQDATNGLIALITGAVQHAAFLAGYTYTPEKLTITVLAIYAETLKASFTSHTAESDGPQTIKIDWGSMVPRGDL